MKQKILLSFAILLSCSLSAQKEAYNWFFGVNTGLTFNATQDVAGLQKVPTQMNGPLNTGEGCFTISDRDGNLIMSSDGITVYDKNNNIMKNGENLLGHWSATQSGIVVPYPENANKYYIFTAPDRGALAAVHALYYNVVDMTGGYTPGLGEITTKNQPLSVTGSDYTIDQVYENIAAVSHSNGRDYWLVHRMRNVFLSWLITPAGVSTTPVVSSFSSLTGADQGAPASYYGQTGVGVLRISSDGTKIAHGDCRYYCSSTNNAACGVSFLTWGNFNTATGVVTNVKTKDTLFKRIYGIEFSPSGEFIYLTRDQMGGEGLCVMRWDDLDTATVPFEPVVPSPGVPIWNVQLGPDFRLYGISRNKTSLWVISNPDNWVDASTNITEVPNFFTSPNLPQWGLPTFIASFFSASEIESDPVVPACINTEITFSVEVTVSVGVNQVTKLEWDFGDGTIVFDTDMTKTLFSEKHTYVKPGTYTLTLTPYRADGTKITNKVKTLEVPISRCIMPVNPNVHIFK